MTMSYIYKVTLNHITNLPGYKCVDYTLETVSNDSKLHGDIVTTCNTNKKACFMTSRTFLFHKSRFHLSL